MRRIGRIGSTVRFVVLAVVTLAVLLGGAVACDVGGDGTEELIFEPIGTPVVEVLLEAPGTSSEAITLVPPPCVTWTKPKSRSRDGFVKWSPDSSRVLFTDGPEVYAVGADGSGLRQVVAASPEGGGDMGPMTYFDLSPDGMSVVYSTCNYLREGSTSGDVRPEDFEFELETVNFDGTDARRLTANDAYDNFPVWSPDGERIAFVSGGGPGDVLAEKAHIHSMAADGTDRRVEAWLVRRHPPQWSPDGERIAYVKFDGDRNTDPAIYVVGAGGGEPQRLTDAVSGPTWSPDGSRIAFAKVDGDEIALYTIAVDGTDARRLTAIDGWQPDPRYGEPNLSKVWIQKVSWSPEGSQILFVVNNERGRVYAEVHVIGAEGGGLARVTVDHPRSDWIEDASWSSDGSWIAISGEFGVSVRKQSEEAAVQIAQIALVAVAVNGSEVRVLVGRTVEGDLVGLVAARGDISAHVAACGNGVAVPDPEANPGLVEDCKALLEVQNALAGPWGLNWYVEWNMSEWEGVVVGGSPPRVREVVLARRGLGGEIPPELSRLTELRVLALGDNALMGEIPAELGDLKNLEQLNLRQNYLSGEIPPELSGLTELIGLSLADNNLRGEIPRELSECSGLTGLSLEGNNLRGEIPGELGKLSQLTYLTLARNSLEWEIPGELGLLTNLRYLDLSRNELVGEIPVELGRLTSVERLRLNYNRLTGTIPAELGQLVGLRELSLHDNRLTGTIPSELGDLPELQHLWLSVSDHQFTGCIPRGLREIGSNDLDDLELPECE